MLTAKMMPTSILNENPIPLAEAAKLLPSCRRGRPIHPSTLARWATRGARGKGGQRVLLTVWKIGGALVTSQASIDQFIAALSAHPDAPAAAPPRTPAQRNRASERAAAKLAAAGI